MVIEIAQVLKYRITQGTQSIWTVNLTFPTGLPIGICIASSSDTKIQGSIKWDQLLRQMRLEGHEAPNWRKSVIHTKTARSRGKIVVAERLEWFPSVIEFLEHFLFHTTNEMTWLILASHKVITSALKADRIYNRYMPFCCAGFAMMIGLHFQSFICVPYIYVCPRVYVDYTIHSFLFTCIIPVKHVTNTFFSLLQVYNQIQFSIDTSELSNTMFC